MEKVNVTQRCFKSGAYLFIGQEVFYSCPFTSVNHLFLSLRLQTVIIGCRKFTCRYVQNRFSRNQRGVYIVFQEGKFAE